MDRHDESMRLYEEARSKMAAGDKQGAISLFQQSVLLYPHFKTLELLGECLLELERPIEAVVPLAAATALNRQVRAPALLAQAFLSLGDVSRAREFAKLALDRDPNNHMAKEILLEMEDVENG